MKTIPALTASKGLKIDVDPMRTSGENGVVWLTSCQNVDVDMTGMVKSRKGYRLLVSGNWRSLCDYGEFGGLLGVLGDGLAVVKYDGSGLKMLRRVQSGKEMFYAVGTDGRQDVVFYGNGVEGGKVVDGVSYPYAEVNYVGPETTRELGKVRENLIPRCLFQGRLVFSEGSVVWYSEPASLEVIDYGKNWMAFPEEVVSVIGVGNSVLFVGTGVGGYLVYGREMGEMVVEKVIHSRCLRGGVVGYSRRMVVLADEGLFLVNPICVVAEDGVYLVDEERKVKNITLGTLGPKAFDGTGSVVCGNLERKFIFSLEE